MAPCVGQHLPASTVPPNSHRDIPKSAPFRLLAGHGPEQSHCSVPSGSGGADQERRLAPRHTRTKRKAMATGGADVEVHGVGLKRCLHERRHKGCMLPERARVCPRASLSEASAPAPSLKRTKGSVVRRRSPPGPRGPRTGGPCGLYGAERRRRRRPRCGFPGLVSTRFRQNGARKRSDRGPAAVPAASQATTLPTLVSQTHILGEPPPPKPRASAL